MQNYMNTNHFMTGFQGMPPSRLGFVCKPDMPPHINILFRARPPLEFVEKPFKGKCRKYEGMVSNSKNILEMFEKTKPERRPIELTETKRLKSYQLNSVFKRWGNKEDCSFEHNENSFVCNPFGFDSLFFWVFSINKATFIKQM